MITMNVKRLDITNFRGIKDLSIEFDPRINVFIGENGTGKTAVLDAIATILSPYGVKEISKRWIYIV